MIVDAQVHIWHANTPERPWPAERAHYSHGPREFGAETILAAMDHGGVDGAVLVPAFCAGDSNDIALDAARRYPDRFAVVGRMTMGLSGARSLLEHDLAEGMRGLRLTFLDDEASKLTDGTVDWVWRLAEQPGIPLMAMAPQQSAKLLEIARAPRFAACNRSLGPQRDRASGATRKRLQGTACFDGIAQCLRQGDGVRLVRNSGISFLDPVGTHASHDRRLRCRTRVLGNGLQPPEMRIRGHRDCFRRPPGFP